MTMVSSSDMSLSWTEERLRPLVCCLCRETDYFSMIGMGYLKHVFQYPCTHAVSLFIFLPIL